MPLQLFEAEDSRNDLHYGASGGGVTLRWIVTGETDEALVFAAVLGIAPTAYLGFIRRDFVLEKLGGPNWKVNVPYGTTGLGGGDAPTGVTPEQPTEPGGGGGAAQTTPLGAGYSFDTTGGTAHLTQSFQTRYSILRDDLPGDAPDYKRAIQVGEDGVAGVDVPARSLKWSRTVAREVVTLGYIDTISDMVGKVNAEEFYGFPAHSVTYLGATGQFTEGEKWSVTHNFEVFKQLVDEEICEGLEVPEVFGSDFLWVKYDEEAGDDEIAPRPIAAYVEIIKKEADFGDLEIS